MNISSPISHRMFVSALAQDPQCSLEEELTGSFSNRDAAAAIPLELMPDTDAPDDWQGRHSVPAPSQASW